ncbi:putative glycoside hydrolase [Corynebacterium felinum]|uniref:Uncharacterized protein n=1 Tax=Corynebacterium felinum TaxID=131318 RepID=A0ABU2B6E0_9CORY|nr:putative glycoside hydrolase [Corynebacterium felinum]MDF5820757.1 putative glycoside hydrolase [Corynebacterium felinum]MDR7354189.1 hypothetical protein [Corynebacterium felinum]
MAAISVSKSSRTHATQRPRPRLAWVRYGYPISPRQLRAAAGKFRVAILQPWEVAAAQQLKEANPHTVVLAYKCLSSVRTYEPGPVYSSGISPQDATALNTCATDEQWAGYAEHVQQKVWEKKYQDAWVRAVVGEIAAGPFDGVMADNDVFGDYYGHGLDMGMVRSGLDTLVHTAGAKLNEQGKLLVPNIAESRCEPERWLRHSRFGGGFEECWLGWGNAGDGWLDVECCLDQMEQMDCDGLIIARVPAKPWSRRRYVEFALAAAWVFFPTRDIAVTATAHDDYSCLPLYADLDLGLPVGGIKREGNVFYRDFTHGQAAVNLGATRQKGLMRRSGQLRITRR